MSGYPQLETFERAQLGKASFSLYDLLTCSQCHSNALPGWCRGSKDSHPIPTPQDERWWPERSPRPDRPAETVQRRLDWFWLGIAMAFKGWKSWLCGKDWYQNCKAPGIYCGFVQDGGSSNGNLPTTITAGVSGMRRGEMINEKPSGSSH